MKIVTVILLEKGAWKSDLTYFSGKDIPLGSIVKVSLRNKKILGLAVSSEDVSSSKGEIKNMRFDLKKIIEVKEHSIFTKEFLEATFEISKYFASKQNHSMGTLIPALFREEYDKIAKFQKNTENKIEVNRNIKIEKLLFQASFDDRISSYKTLIRSSFAEKKSVFIVLPSEKDITVYASSLSKGIENFVFSMHSGFSTKKILNSYENIVNTTHPILIIATAPYLAIPRADVGTIILEHENTNIYKMIGRPHIDLRTFAELYASKIKAKFIIADSLLRYETIARRDLDHIGELRPLSFRNDFNGEIDILTRGEKFQILTDETIEEIKKAISNKKRMFIFSLRKGLATITVCKDCNTQISCEKCLAPVVLYTSRDGKKRMFMCNRCHTEKDPDMVCIACGSWNLMPLGIGTDTVYEEIKRLFSEHKNKIFKLDKEIAKTAKGAEKIVKEFEDTEGSILVGTEMAFFYLKEKISLSIVASFDSLWSIPNYKMGEKIIQIITSIISKTENKLIIQTKNEKDPAILAVKRDNLLPFVREELEDRKNLGYPPYKRFIKITHLGNKEESLEIKKFLTELFEGYKIEIFSAFVSRLKGQYATNALIKLDIKKWSLPELSADSSIDENLLNKLLSLPFPFEVLVDPEDLL